MKTRGVASFCAHGRRGLSVVAMLAVTGLAASANAQVITWNVGSGGWGTAANWLPVNVPDNVGEDAVLGGGAAYTVSLSTAPAISPTIGALSITNPLALLNIDVGRILTLNANSTNNGVIQINPQGQGGTTQLSVGTALTLGGTGEVRLRTGASNSQIGGTAVLTNGPSHTIRGVGRMVSAFTNQGLIAADSSLFLASTNNFQIMAIPVANTGTLSSRAGSTLLLSGTSITQTGGARCSATAAR